MAAFAARRTIDLYTFIRQNPRCRRTFSSSCTQQSHYETLGVPRTATSGQIKTSFYRLSQKYHPDINKEPGAREKFQKVSAAWAVLKDGREKREYDKTLRQDGALNSAEPGAHYPSSPYYDHTTEWPSHSRQHARQSAEWAWSYNPRTSGGSAFRRPHRANDPFSNPHVQRATGKTRMDSSSASGFAYSEFGSYSGPSSRTKRKSASAARAEEEHAREAEANSQAGLWNTFPTIGVTLIFLLVAHGWGARA